MIHQISGKQILKRFRSGKWVRKMSYALEELHRLWSTVIFGVNKYPVRHNDSCTEKNEKRKLEGMDIEWEE